MELNKLAMIGAMLIYGLIFWLTHDDEDAYYPDEVEVEGIPFEELE